MLILTTHSSVGIFWTFLETVLPKYNFVNEMKQKGNLWQQYETVGTFCKREYLCAHNEILHKVFLIYSFLNLYKLMEA